MLYVRDHIRLAKAPLRAALRAEAEQRQIAADEKTERLRLQAEQQRRLEQAQCLR